jgi:predicted MFS family arabinose efflux permease
MIRTRLRPLFHLGGKSEAAAVSRRIPGKAAAWSTWGLAVAFVLYLFGFQTGYAIVSPGIARDNGLTVDQVGLIAAVYTWSFALFQLFSGALLDRLGARTVLLPAIALTTLGVFFSVRAASLQALLAAQIVLALGACAGFVGAGYVGGRWFGMAKFSVMFGLVQFSASLFSAFSQNLAGFALKHMEWRELFSRVGVAGVVLLVVSMMFLRDPASAPATGRSPGMGGFFRDLLTGILQVARLRHVWLAALYGALVFGALLGCGVLWAPKLMRVRGLSESTATLAASVLWLGLAAGCLAFPRWSDLARSRRIPVVVGIALQLSSLLALLYLPRLPGGAAIAFWFLFGFGAAAHMIAFAAASDVVKPELIGTSAAIVNGTMFLVSGLFIARPGQIAGALRAAGEPVSLALAQRSLLPLALGLGAALVVAALIRESYPRTAPAS